MGLAARKLRMAATAAAELPVAGAVLWLDASDTSTITDVGAGAVSEWRDKTASGWDVGQTTSGARPTTGTVTVNSLNVIDFDGGDFLSMSSSSLANAAITVFVVGREDTAVEYSGFITTNTGSSEDNATGWTTQTGDANTSWSVDRVGGAIGVGVSGPTPLGIYAARMASGGTVNSYIGTGTTESTTTSTTGTTTGILVGGRYQAGAVSGSYRLNGAIAEIVVYDSTLSTTDTNTVGDYLADKWSLTWTAI